MTRRKNNGPWDLDVGQLTADLREVRAQNRRLREALEWFLRAYSREFVSDPPMWEKAKAVAREKAK